MILGVFIVVDIVLVREYGFREFKLFFVVLLGGVGFFKVVGGLFKDIKFCLIGGIF